jgi:hypothetical protein
MRADDAVDVYGNGSVIQRREHVEILKSQFLSQILCAVQARVLNFQNFRQKVAAALGKAAAAFVTTGTAANQACVRAAIEKAAGRMRVALHPTLHLVHLDCLLDGERQRSAATLEERAQVNLLGLQPVFFGDVHRCTTGTNSQSSLSSEYHIVNIQISNLLYVMSLI